MKVLILGATGTAGSGVLRVCLHSREVSEVRILTRHPHDSGSEKLVVFLNDDYIDYAPVRDAFVGVDACFYCLGISVRQVSGEIEYRRITHDFAIAASVQLKSVTPDAIMHFISGQGTKLDSQFMWARVKAETEQDLAKVIDSVFWRPSFIDGGTTVAGPRLYQPLRPMFRLLRFSRRMYVTSEDIGRAMLQASAEGIRRGVIENVEMRERADRARHVDR